VLLVIVWAISAALLISHIDRGWVPHDEGLIGHTAERVLAGELPHRDFDDVYTGGLAYINAGAMRAFGMNIRSPRIVLVAVFLMCVPALFYAASRFASAVGAAVATLLGVVWSVPNYTAALPSWYNLIFAVFGTAALLRFVDVRKRRWLFVAGVCGGMSFLMKLIGLYYIAAVVLFLIYREQEGEDESPVAVGVSDHSSGTRGVGYSLFVALGLSAFVFVLLRLVRGAPGPNFLIQFVLPGAVLSAALLYNERRVRARRGPSPERFRALARLALPFMLGVAIPVALFLIPYVTSHSVGDFVRGVFITPARRLTYAAMPPMSWTRGLPALCVAGVALVSQRTPRRTSIFLAFMVAIVGTVIVADAATSGTTYRWMFAAATLLTTVIVVGAAAIVAGVGARPAVRRQRVMIVAAAVAMFALVQFPFAAAVYFCYLTPLLALGALAVTRELDLPSPAVPGALAATFIAFAVLRVYPGFIYGMGATYAPYRPLLALETPRGGGVRVPAGTAQDYSALVAVLQRHATSDTDYIYAAPDAPEAYFLTGRRNPTRTMYDFFDDQESRTTRLLRSLRERDVRVIAINTEPEFSPKVSGELRAALEREYPIMQGVGHFEVRWRE